MTDPQDDIPCRSCPTEGSRSRLDDDGLCPGCRTPAGRLVMALAERGIKATVDDDETVTAAGFLGVDIDDDGNWTAYDTSADLEAADALSLIHI